jgi:hypothetical protein
MGASNTTLTKRLEKALGARVMSLASMPVGFGLQGLKVDFADGRRLAVKLREGSAHADLSLEAYMLGELARHSDLPVPAVHLSEPDLLAMDFIETDGGGITARVERHAAELIAALHATPRPRFGYERDTMIGPLCSPFYVFDKENVGTSEPAVQLARHWRGAEAAGADTEAAEAAAAELAEAALGFGGEAAAAAAAEAAGDGGLDGAN